MPDHAEISRSQATAWQQFRAISRKNLLLRLRGGRQWFGLGGWAAAAVDVLVPVLFFLVMCIPKHYMQPQPSPRQLSPLYPVDSTGWGELYSGPAADAPDAAARLLYAPNTTAVTRLMLLMAKGAACPPDAARPRRTSSTSFYRYFSASAAAAAAAEHPECAIGSAATCGAQPACYLPLFKRQLVGFASAAEAEAAAARAPGTVDAVLDFTAWQQAQEGRQQEHAKTQLQQEQGIEQQDRHRQQGHQQSGLEGAELHHPLRRWRLLLEHPEAPQRLVAVGSEGPNHDQESRQSKAIEQQQQQAAEFEQGGERGAQQHALGSGFVYSYSLRLNHSQVPPTRIRLNQFDLLPGNQYKQYWFFANLQTLVEQAIVAHAVAQAARGAAEEGGPAGTPRKAAAAAAGQPLHNPSMSSSSGSSSSVAALDCTIKEEGDQQAHASPAAATPAETSTSLASLAASSPPLLPLSLSLKPFPWPALTLDLGATAAALFFNMLLVFAFLQPTRAAIMSVVQEKELLLREGMRILGLQDAAFWCSWFLTHWGGMAISGTLCAVVGLYPFQHSSFVLMLSFFWLVAASLLLFAYCISTLFSKTRVAGGAGAVLYSLAMVPGYLMPSLQPYGGAGWTLSCLLPPSAISLFASVLVKHEAVQQGLTWRTLSMPVTVEHSFSAASVYRMLLLDVLLYAGLLWYLDKVMPSDVGQRLPWNFSFQSHYWRPRWGAQPAPHAPSDSPTASAAALDGAAGLETSGGGDAAVRIVRLRKVFRTTDGMEKVAVDGLSLDIPGGHITALLGHNGAGKTTTISILTGLLPATSGDAFFFQPGSATGLSVRRDMAAIRGSMGVCPQFDVLWPQLTVREHLELFAAIKGYATRQEQGAVAEAAAAEVGLAAKLGAAAGQLSGGQKRKLSVALAFVGDPSVVILDEPTSGMDPYTRRFTWDVIQARRARSGTAVLLTSHSMEEADLLADRIAIMAHGRLAALGTSLELKTQFGVGYTLTLSLMSAQAATAIGRAGTSLSDADGGGDRGSVGAGAQVGGAARVKWLTALVRRHVPEAQLLSASGSEAAYRLPKEAAAAFPPLLRALEGARGAADGGNGWSSGGGSSNGSSGSEIDPSSDGLAVAGYGLSETTLEEVFLRVSEEAGAAAALRAHPATDGATAAAAAASTGQGGRSHSPIPAGDGKEQGNGSRKEAEDEFVVVNVPRQYYLKGWVLWMQQLRALLAKRALCAVRDWWAALVQVAVPVLLVLLALWSNRLSAALPQQPALQLNRPTALSGYPAAFGAAENLRQAAADGGGRGRGWAGNGSSGGGALTPLDSFLAAYPGAQDSGTSRLLTLPLFEPLEGSLDAWLLHQWYNSSGRHYDAFFLHTLPDNLTSTAAATGSAVWYDESAMQYSETALQYSVLANQTAIHGMPAAITQVHAALLRWLIGDSGADIRLASHPLPALPHEQDMRITQEAGTLLLVMCVVLATSVLSASFAIFLVRERASGSKSVQLIAGASPSAFWAAHLFFDLAYYSVPTALMLLLFAAYNLPAFSGPRLAAIGAMLWGCAPAALCLTYLVQAAFQDEVRVLVRANSLYFTTGYLGYLAVWILDTIQMFLPRPSVNRTRRLLKALLQSLSPHFCVARGLHQISSTYQPDQLATHLHSALSAAGAALPSTGSGIATDTAAGNGPWPGTSSGGKSPWSWEVSGQLLASLAVQAVLYGCAVLLVETGVLTWAVRQVRASWSGWRGGGSSFEWRGGYRRLAGGEQEQEGSQAGSSVRAAACMEAAEEGVAVATGAAEEGGLEEGEDEDVAAERAAIQSGRVTAERVPVLLQGVSKTYWQAAEDSRPDTPSRQDQHSRGHGQEQQHNHSMQAAARYGSGAVHAVRDLWLSMGRQRASSEPDGNGSTFGTGNAPGQCFGLLGVNGAGKTTTFRMLTGEVEPDTGDALVGGLSLLRQPAAARQLLGYCPQASALPAQMTGREVVRMYARLRGLPERLVDLEARRLLKQLGLEEYGGRACGSYSGGNRRKLSVASALVGCPPVVLLDEPSTGMDPGARHALWGVIQAEMDSGRTVVLTSHSMEECEAVCGRVGIMSGGRLRALGSVQHLKTKHGQGYSLEMRVPPGCVAAATQLVTRCCPAARRRPQRWQAAAQGQLLHGSADSSGDVGGLAPDGGGASDSGDAGDELAGDTGRQSAAAGLHLSFAIPQAQADLPALFEALEAARSKCGGGHCGADTRAAPVPGAAAPAAAAAGAGMGPQSQALPLPGPLVLEYSLSQTRLEQVFLALAAAAADAQPSPAAPAGTAAGGTAGEPGQGVQVDSCGHNHNV